ncbi:MAG: KamA family radical SAM protein [Simkaniaceae bacterium]|nr:KamA family radical SAM protein [Simkaniaceae bacterium]
MWRQIQHKNFKKLSDLAQFLELPLEEGGRFPLNVPRRLAEKMEKGNWDDTLLRQFVPLDEERACKAGFTSDPVGDNLAVKGPKLLHKYKGRVLLLATSACAMHCRYCFRQNFGYEKNPGFTEEIAYIRSNPSIHEVILSGGDPLSLSDEKLIGLFQQLDQIQHVKLLRFHTRFPIGIPERITSELVLALKNLRLQPVFVLHINHPREIDLDVIKAVKRLPGPLLCQSVLLKGVNDDFETLKELCLSLVSHGVIPYYLHQLDRVQGAAHFEVPIDKGLFLVDKLRLNLPGYAVPTFVQEVAGEGSKTPLHAVHRFERKNVEAACHDARG